MVSICRYYGKEISFSTLRDRMGTDSRGTTIKGIVDGLTEIGFENRAIFIKRNAFEKGNYTLPAVARMINERGLSHYVAVYSVSKGIVTYMDPAKDKVQKKTVDEFYTSFDGQMILLSPTPEFITGSEGKETGFFGTMLSIVKPQKDLFIVALVASVLLTIVGIALSIFNKTLIDELIPYREEDQLMMIALILCIIVVTKILLSAFRSHIITYLSQNIDIPLTLGYFAHIFRLPMNFFASRKTGDLITRFQDSATVKNVMTNTALTALIDVIMIVVIGIVLFTINVNLFLITVLMAVLNSVLVYLFKGSFKKVNMEMMEQGSKLNSALIESLSGIETIKANACEERVIDNIEEEFIKTLRVQYRSSVLSNIHNSLAGSISSFGNLAIVLFGGVMAMHGDITIGTMMAFVSLSGYFIDPIDRIVGMQINIQEAQMSLKRLSEIYDMEEEEKGERNKDSKITSEEFKGITLEHVKFRYGSRPLTLKDISMEIRPGEKIAVVGRSGCGKTTLTKLLLKFYSPEDGTITYNGQPLSEVNAFALRNSIGYVPQFTTTFSGTIRDNLTLGLSGITDEKLDWVCRLTACDEFINRLPAGYRTTLDADGGGLSGGEKQRLSIARAILRNPKFIIFDEATSNMDFITEKKTYEMLFTKMDVAALFIAHRLSTIRRCDRIYVVDKGVIAESGTHDELLAAGGLYADMWRSQIGENTPIPVREEKEVMAEPVVNEPISDEVMSYD
ncbi:MAG: peptidase domain-containing ABC transporter [archaeon]|nr:peptidase domain-containing ABC transporter [archaeon]